MSRKGLSFHELKTAIEHREFEPLYFLYGDESFLVDEIQRRIIENAVSPEERDFNLDIVYGAESEASHVLGICGSFPVMSERRLVVVRDFEKLKDNRLFKSYAEQPNPTAVVVLVCRGRPNLSAHPYRALKDLATWAEMKPLTQGRMPGWIADHVRSRGIEIGPRACEMLSDFVGTDLRAVATEVEKLTAFIGERTRIEPDDIIRASGQTREFNVFEMQRAIGDADYPRAFRILERLLQQSSNPGGESIRIVSILTGYFTKLWKLTICQEKGLGEREMTERLGISPYFMKEYVRSLRYYHRTTIERAFGVLLAGDFELKGGASRGEQLVMQLMLTQLMQDVGEA